MELNLRKARKLESKIDNLAKKLTTNLKIIKNVRVNADVHTEVLPELVKARNEFSDSFGNIMQLIDARFEIRQLISDKNHESGINARITKKTNLENKSSRVNLVLETFDYLDEKELEDNSQRKKAMLENGDRFATSTFAANFLLPKDEEDYKSEKIKLSREIESIEDELLDLNASVKIKLSKELVSLLQNNNLL